MWRCNSGYARIGTGQAVTCWENTCNSDRNMIDGLCYEKCPSGYKYNSNTTPTFCVPSNDKGLFYTQTDNKLPGVCPSNAELVSGLCFTKCPTGYTRDSSNPLFCRKN